MRNQTVIYVLAVTGRKKNYGQYADLSTEGPNPKWLVQLFRCLAGISSADNSVTAPKEITYMALLKPGYGPTFRASFKVPFLPLKICLDQEPGADNVDSQLLQHGIFKLNRYRSIKMVTNTAATPLSHKFPTIFIVFFMCSQTNHMFSCL